MRRRNGVQLAVGPRGEVHERPIQLQRTIDRKLRLPDPIRRRHLLLSLLLHRLVVDRFRSRSLRPSFGQNAQRSALGVRRIVLELNDLVRRQILEREAVEVLEFGATSASDAYPKHGAYARHLLDRRLERAAMKLRAELKLSGSKKSFLGRALGIAWGAGEARGMPSGNIEP